MLFLATNLAIMIAISIIFSILGLQGALDAQGVHLNLTALLMMSAVIGMSGSVISLFMSKWSAKQSMGVHVIEYPQNQTEQWLFDTVARQSQLAGIGMPEVGIFDAPDANAFATGANRDHALVAVSTGLLSNMSADEVEAVLGHEISHVANGDMVTMALMQGVVNTFVYFFATVIGYVVDRVVFKTERGYGPAYYVTQMIAQIAFDARNVVFTLSGIPCGCGRRSFGRPPQNDRCPTRLATITRTTRIARRISGIWHQWWRHATFVHESPAT
jgi:heat shock protein HtpX